MGDVTDTTSTISMGRMNSICAVERRVVPEEVEIVNKAYVVCSAGREKERVLLKSLNPRL